MSYTDALREMGLLTGAQALSTIEEVAVGDDDRFTALHTMLLSGGPSVSSMFCFAEGRSVGCFLGLVEVLLRW